MSAYVTKEQVQERLQVSKDLVGDLIAEGKITAVKIGRCVRIEAESVERYLEQQKIINNIFNKKELQND